MSKILSLAAVNSKLKQLSLKAYKQGNYFFLEEIEDKKEAEIAFQKWKEQKIVDWKKNKESQQKYFARYYPAYAFKPDPLPSTERFRKDYIWSRDNEHKFVRMSEGTASFSCAISEFGSFTLSKNTINTYWEWLFRWYVATTKYHILRCYTPVIPSYAKIRAGLKAAGFKNRGWEKSNHGKYRVDVWELNKPHKKETKKKVK